MIKTIKIHYLILLSFYETIINFYFTSILVFYNLAPLLNIFGGKLTTYRKLADNALNDLKVYLPSKDNKSWTKFKRID